MYVNQKKSSVEYWRRRILSWEVSYTELDSDDMIEVEDYTVGDEDKIEKRMLKWQTNEDMEKLL